MYAAFFSIFSELDKPALLLVFRQIQTSLRCHVFLYLVHWYKVRFKGVVGCHGVQLYVYIEVVRTEEIFGWFVLLLLLRALFAGRLQFINLLVGRLKSQNCLFSSFIILKNASSL